MIEHPAGDGRADDATDRTRRLLEAHRLTPTVGQQANSPSVEIDGDANPCPTDSSNRATTSTGHTLATLTAANPATTSPTPTTYTECTPNFLTSFP